MRDRMTIIVIAVFAVVGTFLIFRFHFASIAATTKQNDEATVETGAAEVATTVVPITVLAEGSESQIQTKENYLITSEDELATLWSDLGEVGTPPAVDFSSYDVLMVSAGEEPTTGYSISVSKVTDTDSSRTVSILTTSPGASCVTAQTITSPFTIVLVPHSTLPLSHEDLAATVAC